MKRALVFLTLSVIGEITSANDTFFFLSGGALYPPASSYYQVPIEMSGERITIELLDDHYLVDVTFEFRNHGRERSLLVGFPVLATGMSGRGRLTEFRSWSNGVPDTPELQPIERTWGTEVGIETAWTRRVEFAASRVTTTRVRYRAEYGISAPGLRLATYLYGSGSSWHGPIGEIELEIVNRSGRWVSRLDFAGESYDPASASWDGDTLHIIRRTVEPNYTDTIVIYLSRPFYDDGPMVLPGSYGLERYELSSERLRLLTHGQLRLLRNFIFAMNGYSFSDATLRELFGRYDWYRPDVGFSESRLTTTERANVLAIREEESRREDN